MEHLFFEQRVSVLGPGLVFLAGVRQPERVGVISCVIFDVRAPR